MTCHEVNERAVPYLELDLDPSLVRDVTAHLEGCTDCRAEMEAVRQVLVRLKGRTVPDPGEQFWEEFPDQVRRRLAQAQGEGTPLKQPSRRFRSWNGLSLRSWSMALAASVMLLVGAWLLAGLIEPRNEGPVLREQTVAQAPTGQVPVEQLDEPSVNHDRPDLIEEDWPGDWEDDPDTILVEMASSLDRRTVDRLFEDI